MLAIKLAIAAVLVVVVVFAAILLARTVSIAQRIDAKVANIAKTGRGINMSTDSIIQLGRTNDLATSILQPAAPLDGSLTDVVARAAPSAASPARSTARRGRSTRPPGRSTAREPLRCRAWCWCWPRSCSRSRVLWTINRQLEVVIGAVGEIASRTEPVAGVVESIADNLDGAANTLTALLERKVGAEDAAQLVALVDPLAANGRPAPSEPAPFDAPYSAAGETHLVEPEAERSIPGSPVAARSASATLTRLEPGATRADRHAGRPALVASIAAGSGVVPPALHDAQASVGL